MRSDTDSINCNVTAMGGHTAANKSSGPACGCTASAQQPQQQHNPNCTALADCDTCHHWDAQHLITEEQTHERSKVEQGSIAAHCIHEVLNRFWKGLFS